MNDPDNARASGPLLMPSVAAAQVAVAHAILDVSTQLLEILDFINRRQLTNDAFKRADQQTNQFLNIMVSLLKAMNELRENAHRGL